MGAQYLISTNGISEDEEISSITDLEAPSQQFVLITEDREYLFNGYRISDNYIQSLWNSLGTDKQASPQLTVIMVTAQQLSEITSSEVTAYSTPLMPSLDSYLILISYKDSEQFKESIQYELVRIWSDGYIHSLSGNELLAFDKTVKELAMNLGVTAPNLLYDNAGVV